MKNKFSVSFLRQSSYETGTPAISEAIIDKVLMLKFLERIVLNRADHFFITMTRTRSNLYMLLVSKIFLAGDEKDVIIRSFSAIYIRSEK